MALWMFDLFYTESAFNPLSPCLFIKGQVSFAYDVCHPVVMFY